jgi:hypothetical protein
VQDRTAAEVCDASFTLTCDLPTFFTALFPNCQHLPNFRTSLSPSSSTISPMFAVQSVHSLGAAWSLKPSLT